MSITLGQLASRFALAAQKVQPVSDQKLRTLAQVGVGLVKSEIQGMHAVDTGTMLNSTTAEQAGKSTFLVGPTVKYAPYVALGTSRMPARPFHIEAARKLSKQADEILNAGDLGL
ncbi:minor capsid protein [Microbacterium phage HerculesXL]|jgi:hypothetical protein|nr:minor capsid protein [Microbacterium phage HerculesXL]WNN95213.1 minor capsid protein [Microbacterium phage Tinyman4]